MKKIFTFFAVALLTASAFAQISLVHSFDGQVVPLTGSGFFLETSFFSKNNKNDNTITLYDSNFSLYKTVNVSVPDGYVFSSSAAYYDIFTNKKVGFFVVFLNTSNVGTNDYQKSMIIDEEGNVLLDLGNSLSGSIAFFYMNNTWYIYTSIFIKEIVPN